MPSNDPNLGLFYGWTLGESGWKDGMDANLTQLGALVHLAVLDRDLNTPPGSPAAGDRYIVGPSPTGAWSGHAGHIAVWRSGAWAFYVPAVGWLAYVSDEQVISAYKISGWSAGVAI
jgi:hypothetical protein